MFLGQVRWCFDVFRSSTVVFAGFDDFWSSTVVFAFFSDFLVLLWPPYCSRIGALYMLNMNFLRISNFTSHLWSKSLCNTLIRPPNIAQKNTIFFFLFSGNCRFWVICGWLLRRFWVGLLLQLNLSFTLRINCSNIFPETHFSGSRSLYDALIRPLNIAHKNTNFFLSQKIAAHIKTRSRIGTKRNSSLHRSYNCEEFKNIKRISKYQHC